MKHMKRILAAAALALAVPSLAQADDVKRYMGSNCSFADNPLASHHRIHHRFTNTSGSSQWITCPVIHDVTDANGFGNSTLEDVQFEMSTTVSNARFEARGMDAGGLIGWDFGTTTNLGGGVTRYNWFDGSAIAFAGNNSAYALEAFIPNGTSVHHYRLSEDD